MKQLISQAQWAKSKNAVYDAIFSLHTATVEVTLRTRSLDRFQTTPLEDEQVYTLSCLGEYKTEDSDSVDREVQGAVPIGDLVIEVGLKYLEEEHPSLLNGDREVILQAGRDTLKYDGRMYNLDRVHYDAIMDSERMLVILRAGRDVKQD